MIGIWRTGKNVYGRRYSRRVDSQDSVLVATRGEVDDLLAVAPSASLVGVRVSNEPANGRRLNAQELSRFFY